MNEILHILDIDAWTAAQAADQITSTSLTADGFVHCSTRAQVGRVVDRFYADVTHLLIAVIDGDHLRGTLRWEAPAHPDGSTPSNGEATELFPHVYGPIPLTAVVGVSPWQEFS